MIRLPSLVILTLAAALSTGQAQEPFAFRGFNLGITTDEFKKLPFPDKAKIKLRAICSNDIAAKGKDGFDLFYIDSSEKKAGIEMCAYFEYSEPLKSYWKRDVSVEGYGQASFRFVRVAGEKTARLYEIAVSFPQSQFASIAPAYIEKFGTPSSELNTEMQNAFGAKFPVGFLEWANSTSSITLIERIGKIDQSGVLYKHTKFQGAAEAQKKAVTGPIKDRL